MSKVVLDDVISGYGLSKINENFQKIEDELNNKVLYRNNPIDEVNTIEQDIDLNGFSLYNVETINGVAVDTFTANVDVVVENIASVNTVASNITNVNIVADINDDVTDVAAVANDVTILAPYAPDVGAYATGIYNNLASEDAGKGAELVEYQGSTVEAALDVRLPEFENYAALDAYDGELLSGAYIKGYSNILDGGHGIFRPTSDTPLAANGIYRQDALGRWWKREFSGSVRADWFGAVGNGVTNDSAAINAAIDYVSSVGKGVVVLTPGKVYGVSASSYSSGIRLKSNVILYMVGSKVKAIGANSPDYRLIWIQEVSDCGVIGGEVEGDRDANSATGEQGHGIYIILNCNNITIQGVTIKNCFGDGIYTGRLCNNIRIINNNITNNRRNNVSVVSSSNVLIEGNEISNANGVAPETGIDIEPNSTDTVSYNIIITNNRIYGNERQGIDFPAPPPTPLIENAIVSNNHIYNNGLYGIKASYIKHITIEGNHIYGNGQGGIVDSAAIASSMDIKNNTLHDNIGTAIDGFCSNSTISGNVILNHTTGYGIRWKFGQHVTISNNIISDSGEDGIYYERAYNCVISGNSLKNTQKNGIFITGTNTSSVTRSRKVSIIGNTVAFSSLLTDNTYSGIFLDTYVNTSIVTGNTVVAGSSGNLPLHAIYAVDSSVFAVNNHTSSGAKSGNATVNVGGVSLPTFLTSPNILSETYVPRLYLPGGAFITGGTGTPEGALGAPIGSIFLRSDGGAGTSFYVKQSGTGNTGWVPK